MNKKIQIAFVIVTLTLTFYALSEDLVVNYSDGTINIPLRSNSSANIMSSNGNVIVNTDETALEICTKLFNASICSGSSGGLIPTITNFIATPSTVTAGGSSTISWTLANSATSCIKSGDWSGTISGSSVSNGNHSELVTGINVSSTYRLQCTNSSGTSVQSTTNVSVANTASCSSFPPILNGVEDTKVYANGEPEGGQYSGLYNNIYLATSNFPFPGISGNKWHFSLTKNQYLTAQFSINNAAKEKDGTIQFAIPTSLEGPPTTATSVSISECPGDFSFHPSQPRCLVKGGALPSLFWSTKALSTPSTKCKLVQGKTYYLNIVHSNNTENDNFATSKCPNNTYCGILGQNSFN